MSDHGLTWGTTGEYGQLQSSVDDPSTHRISRLTTTGNVEMIHSYMANSLKKDSPEMRRIQSAIKEAGMFVVLGYSERDGASLYMAQSFISPEGEVVHHRRKIKPTHVERTLWGDGQADSLKTVVDSPFGRIGGLNCWEHLQP
jgi:nitrilase